MFLLHPTVSGESGDTAHNEQPQGDKQNHFWIWRVFSKGGLMVALWLFWRDSSREKLRVRWFVWSTGFWTFFRHIHSSQKMKTLLLFQKRITWSRNGFAYHRKSDSFMSEKVFYNDPNRFRRLENFNRPRKTDFKTAKKVFLNAENKLPSFTKISRRMKMNVIRKRFSWSPKKWFLVSWKDFLTTANRLKAGKLLSLT